MKRKLQEMENQRDFYKGEALRLAHQLTVMKGNSSLIVYIFNTMLIHSLLSHIVFPDVLERAEKLLHMNSQAVSHQRTDVLERAAEKPFSNNNPVSRHHSHEQSGYFETNGDLLSPPAYRHSPKPDLQKKKELPLDFNGGDGDASPSECPDDGAQLPDAGKKTVDDGLKAKVRGFIQ